MKNQHKVIICSGDSYTEGAELGGDFFIPGYTEVLFDANNKEESEKIWSQLVKLVHDAKWNNKEKYKQYIKECNSRAWPAHLEKLTGIPTINIGGGGISNQEIAYRAVDEFFKIYQQDPSKEIIVFLMLTSPGRYGAPKKIHHPLEYPFNSHQPGYISGLKDREKSHVEYVYEHYTDDNFAWSSYSCITACKTLLRELGAKVYILDSGLWRWFLPKSVSDTTKWDAMTKSLDIKADFSSVYREHRQLAGRHFTKIRHEFLAHKLLTSIDF
jgi:hypothetical protein